MPDFKAKKMSKKILIINGHPNKDSFNFGLVDAYKKGAIQSGATIDEITIGDLEFDPNLQYGYQKRVEHEPDLVKSWNGQIIWFECILSGGVDYLQLPKVLSIGYLYRVWLIIIVKTQFGGTNF